MSQGVSLIVGLGNPGPEYAQTRHNAGFRFVDLLSTSLRPDAGFAGEVGQTDIAGRRIWLLKPTTFMNHSGESVARFAHYYKVPVGEILVAHDELDLPVGAVRLKVGGGDGGHNGLSDVTQKLGPGYVRLRIGIGHPGFAAQVVSYVLKKAPAKEQELIDGAIERAREQLSDIVQGQYSKAMNALHASKP